MKTAVSYVYDILNEETDIDFYTNSVPESAITKPVFPIGRIVEIQGNYTNKASDNPLSIQFVTQVDVWVESLEDVDKYYYSIDSLMRANNWECIFSEQTDDPDLEGAKRIIKRYSATINIDL